jgi:1,2-phenylacetyl-CoA epoxidase PaaB subunit
MARWSVDVIGKKMRHLGTVVASDERTALEEAIKQFAVRPALRSKITVTKVGQKN